MSGLKTLLALSAYVLLLLPVQAEEPAIIKAELKIFKIEEIRVPRDSVQYFYLPIPGGDRTDKIRGFKYIIELPEGVEMAEQLRFTGCNSFARPQLAYPKTTKKELGGGRSELELLLPGIGSTYAALWISSGGEYSECAALTGTSERWELFSGDYTAPPLIENTGENAHVWLLRWASFPECRQAKLSHKSRGIVDADDFVIREKASGKIVFEEKFENGLGLFKDVSGMKIIEQDGNKFVRMITDDTNASTQQGMVSVNGLKITPGTEYQITCKARVSVSVLPDNLSFVPLWIRISEKLVGAAEMKAHYEYDIDGKHVRGPDDTLRIVPDDRSPRFSALESILWSSAENSMNRQSLLMREYLVGLTSVSGIKTHLTSLGLNPWNPLFNGNLDEVSLLDPLCEIVRKHGMKAIPYIAYASYNSKNLEYYSVLRSDEYMREYVSQFGKCKIGKVFGWCQSRMLSAQKDYWRVYCGMFEKAAAVNKWDGLMWDFEQPNMLGSGNSECACFCPECVAAFKKFSGISDFSKIPETPAMLLEGCDFDKFVEPARSILMNYPLEWMKFRAAQNAEMWHSFMIAVRKSNSNALFYLYSGTYQDQRPLKGPWRSGEYYGVHLPTAGKYDVDLFLEHGYSMLGKRGWEIRLAKAAVNTNSSKMIGVINTVGSHFSVGDAVFRTAKNQALQSVAQTEANGYQIYRWDDFDSQTWMQIREANTALAHFEDFFTKGSHFDALSQIDNPKLEHSVWLKGEDRVILIYNNTGNDEKVKIKTDCGVNFASYRYAALNYYTGEKYNDPENITCVVPKWNTAVIHIKAN
jgi:hypothetical protein